MALFRQIFFLTLIAVSLAIVNAEDEANTSGLTFTDYNITEDLIYGHKDGLALTLDVLTPKRDAKGIGLILVSSGSWKSAKSDVASENVRKRNEDHWGQGLLQGGFTLFVVRHGSSPRYYVPEMIRDMNRSVRFVRSVAANHGVDPDKLGITSGSSGGHLALMAAMMGDDGHPESLDRIEQLSSRVQCIVAWFPPTDLLNWGLPKGYTLIQLVKPDLFSRVFGEITDLEQQLKEISPLYYVTDQAPPLLLIHGDSDKTVPLQQSQTMQAKYQATGLPVKLIVKSGGGHSYWPGIVSEYRETWKWFDTHLTK